MSKYNLINLIALLLIVVALPVYALREPVRMDQAQAELRQERISHAAEAYLDICASCHGVAGEGLGAMPALNNPGLAEADQGLLFETIAHSPHGSKMAAWHIEEGGILSDYQIESLVTLILNADWRQVDELAVAVEYAPPTPTVPQVDMAALEGGLGLDPHECAACHEEPAVHVGQFGLNCGRCHTLQAWTPARLTRHTFLLDHGGDGSVACETCHTHTYAENTCYECHDHDPEQMQEKHVEEAIYEFENCAECHPTGIAGEAERLGKGRAGREREEERVSDASRAKPPTK
jgi:mono/diheme cytochrome c family protein